MATIDLAEQIKTTNMFDLAYRTNHGMQLTDDERDVQAALALVLRRLVRPAMTATTRLLPLSRRL